MQDFPHTPGRHAPAHGAAAHGDGKLGLPLGGVDILQAHGALVCTVFIGNGAVQGRGVLLRGSDEPLAVGKSHGRKVCPHVLHGVGVVHPFQHERGVLRL